MLLMMLSVIALLRYSMSGAALTLKRGRMASESTGLFDCDRRDVDGVVFFAGLARRFTGFPTSPSWLRLAWEAPDSSLGPDELRDTSLRKLGFDVFSSSRRKSLSSIFTSLIV